MKNLNDLSQFRDVTWELAAHGVVGDSNGGCFSLEHDGVHLRVIASSGSGWDHVSVSTATRCPTWEEMEYVRKLFAKPHEVWVQFGVPSKDHINCHPYCLHWWRPQHREVKLPPAEFVGPRATRRTQSRNTRRNIFLSFEDRTLCLTDWARRYGFKSPACRKGYAHAR